MQINIVQVGTCHARFDFVFHSDFDGRPILPMSIVVTVVVVVVRQQRVVVALVIFRQFYENCSRYYYRCSVNIV